MTVDAPFQGVPGANQVLTVVATTPASTTLAGKNKSVRLVNSGVNICHVRVGSESVTATTTETPVLAGEALVVQKAQDDTIVDYVSALGTTLHVQPGEGGY